MQDVAGASKPNQVTEQECPQCHTMMPVNWGYVTWCDRCGWNVQPHQPQPPRNIFEAQYERLGKKLGKYLFNDLVNSQTLAPRLTVSKILAFAIATLVHGLTIIVGAIGIGLILTAWPSFLQFMNGLLFVGIAWLLRPRFPEIYVKEHEV